MKVNELAQISGVSTKTVRYYESIGLMLPVRQNNLNYRKYTQKDVDC